MALQGLWCSPQFILVMAAERDAALEFREFVYQNYLTGQPLAASARSCREECDGGSGADCKGCTSGVSRHET
jgi:hypothetical protein